VTERIVIGARSEAWPSRLAPTLDSIARNTTLPHELLVLSDRNGAACLNQLMATGADAVVLLESGALVGPGWLDHLMTALRRPHAGLAGPSTNHAWNEQRFAAAGESEEEIARVAGAAALRHGGAARTLAPLYSLGDFCYAVKRGVFEAIGPADEGYGAGPCWEMDFNVRAARAGLDGLWAGAAYVWRAPVPEQRARDESAAFEASRRRYQDKFCGARLRGEKTGYRQHCRGDACRNFAPRANDAPVANPTPIAIPAATPSDDAPLVSCIMPTYDRRAFVPDAIRGFLAQDYPRLELIVVDDGTDAIDDLLPDDPRIRYVRLSSKISVGAKRNLACEHARGEIIAHWDDDDWYAASRIRVQVEALRERGGDICGTSVLHFIDREHEHAWTYRYRRGSQPWVAGTSLVYRRAFWETNRFPDVQVGEDSQFVWRNRKAKVVDLDDAALCVAAVHRRNVSPKRTSGACWQPAGFAEVLGIMRAGERVEPLVSCVMSTFDRRPFIPLALECFRRQTYPRRELIVVDDGTDPVEDLFRGEPDVRYIRLDRRTTLGAKRNAGIAEARGTIVGIFDDDDWYAERRIERQVAPIVRGEADLTGLPTRHFLELPQRQWWTIDPALHRRMFFGDVAGGTMMFRRAIWKGGLKFPNLSLAEDARFLRECVRRGLRLQRIDGEELFVYVRHRSNTWRFQAGSFTDPSGWKEAGLPDAFPAASVDAYAAAAAESRRSERAQ
jgi:glycosyltransferase involved in cell wall biosynthesis